jgi:hypothetical protein
VPHRKEFREGLTGKRPRASSGTRSATGWGRTEDLTSPSLARGSSLTRGAWGSGCGGTWIILGTVAAVLLKTAANWTAESLPLGEMFVLVGTAQFGIIGLLAAVSWSTAGQFDGQTRPRALPAAAVTLAVALTNGHFAGAALLTARWIGSEVVEWGPELALIDGFVVVLAMWAALTGGWVAWHRRCGDASELPSRNSHRSRELHGVDEAWRRQIARTRGLALAGHRGPQLLVWYAVIFLGQLSVPWVMRRLPRAGRGRGRRGRAGSW